MFRRSTLPRVLLLLAGFVFFSANTVYFLESDTGLVTAATGRNYQFRFDSIKKGPYLNLKSAMLVNYENGEVLYSKDCETVRPIASISKLVAVMVILDAGIDLKGTATITREDAKRSSRSRLLVGFELSLKDLLYAALLNSDNRATRALARATSGSIKEFAVLMNRKVRSLGLEKTVFVEPTGLDSRNVSTAHEVAKILHYAYDYDFIADLTSTKRHRVTILNRKNTYRQMANTNLLTVSPYKVLAGKTGFIRAAIRNPLMKLRASRIPST